MKHAKLSGVTGRKMKKPATSSRGLSSSRASPSSAAVASQASDVERHPRSRRAAGAQASVRSCFKITPAMVSAGVDEFMYYEASCGEVGVGEAVKRIFRAMLSTAQSDRSRDE